jgi:hypothetical protein
MSYSDFLRTKQINAPKIIDNRMKMGDASTFTWRSKLAATYISRPTDHVITNQNNPFLPNPSTVKMPIVYKGTGLGGSVQDASMYTLSLGARSIGKDIFSNVKTVVGGGTGTYCRATPSPSLVVNSNGNIDRNKIGINQGYQDTCAEFKPLSQPKFIDNLPILNKLGVQSRENWNGARGTTPGSQKPLLGCTTTMTTANFGTKDLKAPLLHSARPVPTDFRTSIMGLQVSANGQYGRAPKVGSVIERSKYVEAHHGNSNIDHIVYPRKFIPTTGAPAQLKINSPQHYPVA